MFINYQVEASPPPKEIENPCQPSPCGLNANCRQDNDKAVCSCIDNFIGRPPSCVPECISNSECPNNKACINKRCRDPCVGLCGQNAQCHVVSHTPICECTEGYSGDPFVSCVIKTVVQEEPLNPCVPSPCGSNAFCKEQNSVGACYCLPEYFGNPYQGCRPECTLNSDCPSNRACINSRCKDPCPGTCGSNTECHTINHIPVCQCITGYEGNPYQYCSIRPAIRKFSLTDF